MSGDVFISYRRSDQAKAHLLHSLLKERGVDAWYDTQVGVGEDWRRATAKALDAAPIFVLLFSKSASESAEIGKELAAATFSKKLVVPVRLEDIQPSGEFLYELASRNWFDAFDQTDARFEILADKLAALVKGEPGADVAAPGLGDAQPATGPAPKSLRRRPALVGGLAAAVLALIAAVAAFALRPPASPPSAAATSHLIAFFGVTPTTDDPVVKATAEAATDRVFQSMGGWKNHLSTVARTETRGTPENLRFARAAELGARYALGGEVRPDANGMTLSIRFEDVASRLTLWEKSFSAPASDVAYLPAQASLLTANAMWCIVKTRSELTRDNNEILSLIADRCREGPTTDRNASYTVSRMRAITEADPGSAYNLAQLVAVLSGSIDRAPPSSRATLIAEAEATLQRAEKLDPTVPNLLWGRLALEWAKGVSITEFDATALHVASESEGKDAFVYGATNYGRASILQAAGRFRDALPHMLTAVAHQTTLRPWTAGPYYAVLGRKAEARAEIEPAIAAFGAWAWEPMIPYAIFLDAADADAMLQSPPSTTPKTMVDCLRDIRTALASKDPGARALGATRARVCGDAESISPMTVLASLAALNDLDAAFALADKQTFNATSPWSEVLEVLFWPTSRALRADPRFLPLVDKLGMIDYWRATKSRPDVCETETAPFCAALGA